MKKLYFMLSLIGVTVLILIIYLNNPVLFDSMVATDLNADTADCKYYFIIDDRNENTYFYSEIASCNNIPKIKSNYDKNDFYIRGPFLSRQEAEVARNSWINSKKGKVDVTQMDEELSEYLTCGECD